MEIRRGRSIWREGAPGWAASMALHLAALLFMAVWTLPLVTRQAASLSASTDELEEVSLDEVVDIELETILEEEQAAIEILETPDFDSEHLELDELASADSLDVGEAALETIDFSAALADADFTVTAGGMSSIGLGARTGVARSRMVAKGGGSTESEIAVARALEWIARHQLADGSWNFDHRGGECNGACGNPGDLARSPAGATGLALLPFLGAGNTHIEGKYRDVVDRGIYALASMLKSTPDGATGPDEGQYVMYGHGIATMAMCEAYAMTGDQQLRPLAQAMLAYTCNAQDPNGGGWRYKPRQRGDTSMHGWHVGALKSGFMASLDVPPVVVDRASLYLDAAEVESGEGYCYSVDKPVYGAATSAIGHLCRMYMGVGRENSGLKNGIARLVARGPSRGANGAYFNYYAAQAIFQYTGGVGPEWEKWNEPMREFLVSTQQTQAHEAGSWGPVGDGGVHLQHGGRLYQTAMSCMTLEVYYRLLPIYGAQATQSGFE